MKIWFGKRFSWILIVLGLITINNLSLCYNQQDLANFLATKTCTHCDLSNANLQGYILDHANLEHTNLSGANLSGTQISFANLKYTNLQNTIFNSSLLRNTDFSFANAYHASFVNTHLHNSKFTHTILAQANFTSATAYQTDFSGAHLDNTLFGHTDLHSSIWHDTSGSIITNDRTNFCCTKMSDHSVRSEPNQKCSREEMQNCQA